MAKFEFATLAAYQAAKASGGAIYSAVAGSTEVSASAVSYIKSIGRTVIDAKNTIVPRNAGQIGDWLVFDGTRYCWLKKYVASDTWDTASLGQEYCDSSKLGEYKIVGQLINRRGNLCTILATADASTSCQWDNSTSTSVPNISTFGGGTTQRLNGITGTYVSGGLELAEALWGASGSRGVNTAYSYSYPVPRSAWNQAVADEKAGIDSWTPQENYKDATAADANSQCRWYKPDATDGRVKIDYKIEGGTQKTVYPRDWNYDFERWYRNTVTAKIPASGGWSSIPNGAKDTRVLYNWLKTNRTESTANSLAAGKALAWAVSGVSDYGAGKWWLPSCVELSYIGDNWAKLHKKGCTMPTGTYYWSSSQYSAANAWYLITDNGNVNGNPKTSTYRVRAVSAFEI